MNFQSLLDFDKNLLISLQGIIPSEYSFLVTILAESIVVWCAIFLVATWLYGTFQKNNEYKTRALQVFGLIVSVFVIYTVVNLCVPQWREHPHSFLNGANITPLIPHPTDNSFPSGHALFSGAFIVAVFAYVKNYFLIALTILLALITVCCRVLGGVHYPGDIVAGLFFGIIGALIFKPFVEKIVEQIAPFCIKIASFLKL